MADFVQKLADAMVLSSLLQSLRELCGAYDLVDHWQQGEFHHDIVLRITPCDALPGTALVVATNCNGGVKEVLCFDQVPQRDALWRFRCPDSDEFSGELPAVLARATTHHWFDPCELLVPDARSELREEFRERQRGGGWQRKSSD